MPVYQQMGHQSENLLFTPELAEYRGAILSPVNNTGEEMIRHRSRCQDELGADFDLVFDPQLYYPNTERGKLDRWGYFPADVDTADMSSDAWWRAIVDRLARDMELLLPNAVCSPAAVPRAYSDDFYRRCVDVAGYLQHVLPGGVRAIQTVLINPADLTEAGRALTVASIVTRGDLSEVYLIAITDREPRREHVDTEGLKGVMQLIQALHSAGMAVTVGFCSSDMLLWKEAGATSCATGKFFNLRRFTSSRWEEPRGGGGQLPYWFEESVLAFLRESDIIRVRRQGMFGEVSGRNPFLAPIIECMETQRPWVGLGWRQFLWWFADAEARIDSGELSVRAALRTAEANWQALEDADVLMEEPRNDGGWIRPWRRAVAEFML